MTCLHPWLPLSSPEGISQSESAVSVSPSQRRSGVTCRVIGLGCLNSIESPTWLCCLWRIATSPNFQCSPHRTFIPLWKS